VSARYRSAVDAWLVLVTALAGGGTLDVRCGPVRTQIPLDRIKSVRPVHSFVASSALSVDRLATTYDKFGVIMISPR
jgi:hypothetical protein